MRLLECDHNADFSLTKELAADNIPKYAIFSHTWRADGQEVMFENLRKNTSKRKASNEKIRFCGEQAVRDGISYSWVDTCST